MTKKTLRVGIIGFGFMGKMHAHAYRSLNFYYASSPAIIEFAGVATNSEKSWKHAVEEWGFQQGTTDFRELCVRDDIDVINCCTPNALHLPILECALENGKHLYMDKPLCLNLNEARRMSEIANQNPECITQMAFQYRFAPALLRAKELIESDALGQIFSARVCYLHAGYINPKRPFTWRLDVDQSGKGGALFDLGSHVIDLTRHLLGEFKEVFHVGETMIKERPLATDPERIRKVEVDDISLMIFRLRNGAVGTLESSRLATGTQDEIRFEAHGSRGGIRFNLMQPNYLEYYDATVPESIYGGDRGYKHIEAVARYPKPATLPGPKNTVGWERFHVHSIYNFVSHIVNNTPAQPNIIDGARTQCILDAALMSQERNEWTKVPEI